MKQSFTETKIRLENYQEAFRYIETLNKEIQHSIDIKLETGTKATSITELIGELEMEKLSISKEHFKIENSV